MPANERSVNILSSTGSDMNTTGNEVRYDSWYGYTDGFGTISATYDNYQGKLIAEASLSLAPTSNDWFEVTESANYSSSFSGTVAYNIQGNFTFIRVRMDRSSVGDGTTYDPSYGQISKVILST